MEDKVEIEDTPTGLDRVFIKIFNQPSGDNFTRTVTNPQGEFYGQLENFVQPNDVTADVKMLGSEPDFGFTPQEWRTSVNTLDLLYIQRFILGFIHFKVINQCRRCAWRVKRSQLLT
ncbi:MAG: hypothetical protein IPN76_31850 [Saprospiraceae bacterium]|nr:hypothetical protein [Saprospiraceae bacterium]